jgi:hypothetical protein
MKTMGWVAGLAAVLMSSTAFAGAIFSNSYAYNLRGDCSFATDCADEASRGDDFAAQEFTISELDSGFTPTDVRWRFIQADGAGGLPGTIVAVGTDALSGQSIGTESGWNLSRMSWNVGTVTLQPGTYYLAFQGVSYELQTYLGEGVLPSGAAETQDGGLTWTAGYGELSYPSVAFDIYGATVPEPGTWVLMIVGLAATGALGRRRHIVARA